MERTLFRKFPESPNEEPYHTYGLSVHEIELPDCKISPREGWLVHLMKIYRDLYPRYPEECYQRWAETQLNRELDRLGDYFSLSSFYD